MEKGKTKRAETIFKRILEQIKPSKKEIEVTTVNVNILTERLKEIVPRSVEIKVVGSIARGTNLKGDADIDIFMLFGKKFNKEELTRMGLEYGKKLVDRKNGEYYEIKYAEHPYVKAYFPNIGLKADLVPASKIDSAENLATAVDRSPLHAEFINSRLSKRQKDEVRLLKYFLKAHSIYGAEVKVGGFSGYLCELLICQYGSFLNFFEVFSKIKLPSILMPASKGYSNDEAVAKRFDSRFVVIDPVDKERNVAAAVTEESLAKLVLLSRQFISNPDAKLFYGKGFSATTAKSQLASFIRDSGLETFLLVANVPEKSADILWPQLRKIGWQIEDYIERYGFESYLMIPWIDSKKGFILLLAPDYRLKTRLMRGPDVFKTASTEAFLKKHRSATGFPIRDGSLHVLEKNLYRDIYATMRAVVSGKAMKSHKDISLRSAKLYHNEIPKEYSEGAIFELRKALNIEMGW